MDTRTLRLLEYEKIRTMLAHHTATTLGTELVARMRPARDAAVVRARLTETGEARQLIDIQGHPPFQGVRDVRDAVRRAEKHGVLTAVELLDVAETAAGIRRLRRFLLATESAYPAVKAQAALLSEFTPLEQAIERAIGPNAEVLDSASPALDAARRRVRRLHDEIQRELQRLITSPATLDVLQDPIITQRNGRFCVPVRAEHRNAFRGIVHDLSASGQTAFMEPLTVMELGNDLREAERREEEEVYRVLTMLSDKVALIAERLLSGIETCGRLDLIFARAFFSRAQDAVAPELSTDGSIDLRCARHPLLGETAVPIDIALGDDGQHALIVTGPNTGGKTVTLKTVGLLVVMAQSGLHIPALPGSRLPIFAQVFADIGDEQSIEQSLSTFSSHMTAIVRIVKDAGPHALVLLDEIGAGTDPTEGAALAKAVLLELHARGCRTIATTHYGELKVFAQSTDGFRNASVEFDLDTLRPTYRVISGLPGSSNALSIAQRLGLPKTLIARARELVGEAPQAFEHVLKQAEGARRALDRERTVAAHTRREAEETAKRLQHELRTQEEKREASLTQARERARDVLQKAQQEANALLEELRVALREARATTRPAAQTPNVIAQMPNVNALRRKTRETLTALTESVSALPAPPEPVREIPSLAVVEAGQAVIVRSLGYRGTALERGAGDTEVEVQVGIMRIRVPVSGLEDAPPPVAAAFRGVGRPDRTTARQVDQEIRLLGLRAEEAAERLDEYLYAALDGGLTRVRIVHGFGTGVLRQIVQDVVRHHPAVRTSRAGEKGEGGGGVTIAELGRADD